jgi:hypothetical protein
MSKRILLVDDSITTRVAHRIAINRNTKYEVLCASNGPRSVGKGHLRGSRSDPDGRHYARNERVGGLP